MKLNHRVINNLLSKLKFIVIVSVLLSACNLNKKNNLTDLTIISLKSSINNTQIYTQQEYEIIYKKLSDLHVSEIAKIWQPKALEIRNKTDILLHYFDSLEAKLDNSKKLDKTKLLKIVFEFKEKISTVDSEYTYIISNEPKFDSTLELNNHLDELLLIYSLRNYVTTLENKLVKFSKNKIGYIHDYWGSFRILINQNSKHFNSGDELIIEAGIGEYSRAASPIVKINGEDYKINQLGFVSYKTKVTGNKGKYSIPVEIKYRDQNGEEDNGTILVDYTIDK